MSETLLIIYMRNQVDFGLKSNIPIDSVTFLKHSDLPKEAAIRKITSEI